MMDSRSKYKRKYRCSTALGQNESGMASILITMVTMIVVTLIVLGFAQISRRQQGNTLDRQLSAQAFYAAESAVNDARNVVNKALQTGKAIPAKASCNTNTDDIAIYGNGPNNYPTPVAGSSGVVLDSGQNVSYTCLLVDPSPSVLEQDGVGDNSWVVPIASSTPYDEIKIKWSPNPAVTASPPPAPAPNPSTDCPDSVGDLPPASSAASDFWTCGYGTLRMDLVPTSGALTGGTGGGSLFSKQMTAFFEPTDTSGGAGLGSIAYGGGNIGKANFVKASCDMAAYNSCTATITGLSGTSYTLRLNSIYRNSDITVQALNGGTPVATNGQVLVDATGQANGVIRRIQVRFTANTVKGLVPRYAIQSTDGICKRFFISNGTPPGSGYFSNQSNILDPQQPSGTNNYNAMCDDSLPISGSP